MTEDETRATIGALLADGKLNPEIYPRADDEARFHEVQDRLRAADGDLGRKLEIAGLTLDPVEHEGIEQACETCMYYLVRRKFCDLPELKLPVEPEWSCRLWRI